MPTRRRDASERNRLVAQREAEWDGVSLFFQILQAAALYVPFLYFTYRAWQAGRPWIGGAIFGIGGLLVIGWLILRVLQEGGRRRERRERLREARHARQSRRAAGTRSGHPTAR